MNFCPSCGRGVDVNVPAGDNRPRHVCTGCGTIHYHNPKMVLGTIPAWEDRVLLCRRAIEPRYGYWTLPAGFMENGETTGQGAARETLEEAGARIEMGPLFSLLDVPHVDQVHLFYRARLLDLDFAPGSESLEVRLFREDDVPWKDLAFRTVAQTLRWYFEDRARGVYDTHVGEISYPPRPAA